MNSFRPELTAEHFNGRSAGHLPGLAGLQMLGVTPQGVQSRLEVRKALLAPNGFLHAATVIALADTSCGYGCVAHLPQGATGFTTLDRLPRMAGARGPHDPGLGRGGDGRGQRQEDRHLPLHADGALAKAGTGALRRRARPLPPGCLRPGGLPRRAGSCLNVAMHRWFFGFFFYFPRSLAEGNG